MSISDDRAREERDKRVSGAEDHALEYLRDPAKHDPITVVEDLMLLVGELRKANASSAAMFDEIAPALASSAAKIEAANQLRDLSGHLSDQAGLLAPPAAIEAASPEEPG